MVFTPLQSRFLVDFAIKLKWMDVYGKIARFVNDKFTRKYCDFTMNSWVSFN